MNAATATQLDWPKLAADMDAKSPLEIMDHVRGRDVDTAIQQLA